MSLFTHPCPARLECVSWIRGRRRRWRWSRSRSRTWTRWCRRCWRGSRSASRWSWSQSSDSRKRGPAEGSPRVTTEKRKPEKSKSTKSCFKRAIPEELMLANKSYKIQKKRRKQSQDIHQHSYLIRFLRPTYFSETKIFRMKRPKS